MEEKKNSKVTIIILTIALIVSLGYIAWDKKLKDVFVNNSEKVENGNQKETPEVVTKPSENKITTGEIKVNDTTEVIMNGNKHYITFISISEDEFNVSGTNTIKFDGVTLNNNPNLFGIAVPNYSVFTAADNKEYILITYYLAGATGFILDESGKIIKKIDYYEDLNCITTINKDSNNTEEVYVKDGSIYYYKPVKGSNSDFKLQMELYKIDINDSVATEQSTGTTVNGTYGNCEG